MSILITGMEMPKACYACKLLNEEFWECRVFGNASHSADCRPADCPLVPVPEHGRLIDADALLRQAWGVGPDGLMRFADGIATTMISTAPTIIPADIPVMYYPQVPGITPTLITADKEGEG